VIQMLVMRCLLPNAFLYTLTKDLPARTKNDVLKNKMFIIYSFSRLLTVELLVLLVDDITLRTPYYKQDLK
jgi:hypothetical protein